MKPLKLRELYSRREIHGVFSPDTTFTPQAGTWGLHGIIKIPNRDGDFVFIVTYGQSQGDHDFDEGITSDGVLSWQSQPSQDLQNKVIHQLILHNDLTNNIYLFLRENKRDEYTYYGKLAYLEHDKDREKPVYFQWQLLDWDHTETTEELTLNPTVRSPSTVKEAVAKSLRQSDELPTQKRKGVAKELFRARKSPDYAAKDAKNRKLGLEGELLVLAFEQSRLRQLGHHQLALKIVHTSVIQGDGAGYDIKSFNEDGSDRYIEVKSTNGSLATDFYMSPNEIKFSEHNANNFYLYRVYDMRNESGQASFYIVEGDVQQCLNATPVNYKMSFKG
jgi:hypothetical protein